MVDVKFPYIVYRKNEGLQIRWFGLFKLFPVSYRSALKMTKFTFYSMHVDRSF